MVYSSRWSLTRPLFIVLENAASKAVFVKFNAGGRSIYGHRHWARLWEQWRALYVFTGSEIFIHHGNKSTGLQNVNPSHRTFFYTILAAAPQDALLLLLTYRLLPFSSCSISNAWPYWLKQQEDYDCALEHVAYGQIVDNIGGLWRDEQWPH